MQPQERVLPPALQGAGFRVFSRRDGGLRRIPPLDWRVQGLARAPDRPARVGAEDERRKYPRAVPEEAGFDLCGRISGQRVVGGERPAAPLCLVRLPGVRVQGGGEVHPEALRKARG